MPSATSAGPSANSAKNFVKKAAPEQPPKIIATFEIRASGGESTRLTQT